MSRLTKRIGADLLALALLAGLSSCGGGGGSLPDPGPDAGVDPTTPLSTLTPADQEDLCVWVAGRFGGWGRRINCSNGDYFSAPASESSCVQQLLGGTSATCTETVADLENCTNQVVAGCQAIPAICLDVLFDCGMVM